VRALIAQQGGSHDTHRSSSRNGRVPRLVGRIRAREEDVLHRVLRGLNPHAAAVRDLRRATWNYEHCAATKTDCQVEREMMDVYLRALEATPPRQQ
jgi:hypothetical protein